MWTMKSIPLLFAAAALSACAVVPPPDATPPAPPGSAVKLGQSVRVGSVSVTPIAVVEDSRCPINARCVWAGRLVVMTRVEGRAGNEIWQDSADMRLGESFGTHGTVIALTSGEPARTTARAIEHGEYRFTYDLR